jgi:hypothetical protein
VIRLFVASAVVLGAAGAGATAIAQSPPPNPSDSKIVCKYVVAAGPSRENKPYRMCMSKSDWAMKDARDAKDPNRIVCKYQEDPSAPKLWGYKICQPASEWAEQERMEREHIQRIQMGTCAPGQPC